MTAFEVLAIFHGLVTVVLLLVGVRVLVRLTRLEDQ